MQGLDRHGHSFMRVRSICRRGSSAEGDRESIEAVLHQTRLPARCLEIEITETTIMHSTAHTIAALHELTALGVQISWTISAPATPRLPTCTASRCTS